jgi:hypothetical protein
MTLQKLAKHDVSAAVKTGLVFFSAIHLGTTEFIRNALPSPHVLVLPAKALVFALIFIQVIPFLLIIAADWYIRHRLSPKASSRFRVAVMAGALVLVLRQAQLYMGPTHRLANSLEEASPALLTLTALALSALVVWLTFKLQRPMRTFFYYFSPVAIFLSLLVPFFLQGENARYANFSDAEVAPASTSLDPVFIVVFDEFSYSALLDESGEIDAERYPNFARLGNDSLELTNATGNYFHTWVAVPELIDAALGLSSEYDVRLYEQTHRISAIYSDGCGQTYTCRDANYLRMRNTKDLGLNLAARTLYAAMPAAIETAGRGILHPLLRSIDVVPPSADPLGIHLISSKLLSAYLGDIKAENAGGRVFFLHTLVPHFPYVFDSKGDVSSDQNFAFNFSSADSPSQETFDRLWPHYKEQIEYADEFLGELLRVLDREELWHRSTVIVTSDHGLRLSYPQRNQPIEVSNLTPEVLMFIHSPQVNARKSDIDYQHADFAATLYDVIGFEQPGLLAPLDRLPGAPVPVSALAEERPPREKVFFVDYLGRQYWRNVYNGALHKWEEIERVDQPVGDKTQLLAAD